MTDAMHVESLSTTEVVFETEPARPNRHAVRAAEYRVIAANALSSAEQSGLAHVREKFIRSAEVWTALADADEMRAAPVQARR